MDDLEVENQRVFQLLNLSELRIAKYKFAFRKVKVKRTRKKLNCAVALLQEWEEQFDKFAYNPDEKVRKEGFETMQSLRIMTLHFLENKCNIDLGEF